jgi:hypothetical protein
MKSLNVWVVMLVVCLFLAPAVWAQAPASGNQSAPSASTALVPRLIKFSGTLVDRDGHPMAGPLGVTFALYAQQTGGAALWMETQNVKPDGNGEYTILLGAESSHGVPAELFMTGEARWLGIQMERQTEQERILLVSVPYALKAGDAESLGGLPASAYSLAQPSAPAVSGAPGTSGASGASATGSGAAPQGSTSKSATNAKPQAAGAIATNFIPVFTDNSGTLGSSVLFQNPNSNFLGVGTAFPVSALDLRLTGAASGDVVSVGNQTGGGRFGVLSFSTGAGLPFIVQGDRGDDLVLGANLSEKMRITSAGNVGIGATGPSSKLTVTGVANQLALQSSSSGEEASMAFIPGGSVHTWQAGVNAFGPGFFVYENGGGYRFVVKEGGGVNINGSLNIPNTTGPAVGVITLGGAPFVHNFGTNNTFVGTAAGNFTMAGNANTASGFRALLSNTTGSDNTASGFQALLNNTTGSDNTASGFQALSGNSTGLDNTASGFQALLNNMTGNSNTASGVDALQLNTTGSDNTASGVGALQLNTIGSDNTALGWLAGVTITTANANTTGGNNTFIGFNAGPGTPTQLTNAAAIGANAAVSANNALVLGGIGANAVKVGIGTTTPGAGLDVETNNSLGLSVQTFAGTGTAMIAISNGGDIAVFRTGANNMARIDSSGKGFFDGGTQIGGADFAESVEPASSGNRYEPGDVLVIDRTGRRRVTLSQEAYSTLVAGIYSTKPGVVATPYGMDDPRSMKGIPLAIVGIVPCKASAENGPINVGDLLVTSSVPGYAMKGSDHSRMLGAVVGKALEPLRKGHGVIQILVTLQ